MYNHVYKYKMADNVPGSNDWILTWLDPDRLYTYLSRSIPFVLDTMIDIDGTLTVK